MYSCQSHRIFQLQVCVLFDCFRDLKLFSLVALGRTYFKMLFKNTFNCFANTLRNCFVSCVVMKNAINVF